MKKDTTPAKGSLEPKAAPAPPKTMDEYIAGYPQDVQDKLQEIRRTIKKAAPGAQEAIKYAIPTFVLNGNMISFAAFKKHIGLYPVPRDIPAFKDELAAYPGEKSTVRFALDQPIPRGLITRVVKFRAKEMADRVAAKGKSK